MKNEHETLTSIMEDADKVAGILQLLIQEIDYIQTVCAALIKIV